MRFGHAPDISSSGFDFRKSTRCQLYLPILVKFPILTYHRNNLSSNLSPPLKFKVGNIRQCTFILPTQLKSQIIRQMKQSGIYDFCVPPNVCWIFSSLTHRKNIFQRHIYSLFAKTIKQGLRNRSQLLHSRANPLTTSYKSPFQHCWENLFPIFLSI